MVDKIKIMVNHLDLPQDVIDIIHFYLEGYYQGRKCASELLMPHFQRTLTSIGKKRWGVRRREEVHPGRDLVRIIRPHQVCGLPSRLSKHYIKSLTLLYPISNPCTAR